MLITVVEGTTPQQLSVSSQHVGQSSHRLPGTVTFSGKIWLLKAACLLTRRPGNFKAKCRSKGERGLCVEAAGFPATIRDAKWLSAGDPVYV